MYVIHQCNNTHTHTHTYNDIELFERYFHTRQRWVPSVTMNCSTAATKQNKNNITILSDYIG